MTDALGSAAEPPRRRAWTLRARLVLGLVALLALSSIVIGLVSVLALRASLIARVDQQLAAATSRSGEYDDGPQDRPVLPPGIRPEFVAIGTVSAVAIDGRMGEAIYFDEGAQPRVLSASQRAELLSVPDDGRPHTVGLGSLGEYRVLISPVGSRATVVIGLPLAEASSVAAQLVMVVAIVTLLGIALTAVAATVVVRLALRPLDRVAATATRVSELPLDRGEVALGVRVPGSDADPRTEVGKVGAALNRMLGHVSSALTARQESEQKVRRFVADASHELRTPLASIRGYSELTRRTGHDLPEDVVHSMGRVESEAIRMTSLVEDLLLLARLDEGRDLERHDVDLSRLVADAVSDAQVAGRDHEWVIELPADPVIVTGDEARLHQAIANLLANARVHTPAGTTVLASVEVSDAAVVTVSDDGPGIPSDLVPTLFERFVRGDHSRSRIAGSTGLGLSITRAVVQGHGGSVEVSSKPGTTVFTIRLPLD